MFLDCHEEGEIIQPIDFLQTIICKGVSIFCRSLLLKVLEGLTQLGLFPGGNLEKVNLINGEIWQKLWSLPIALYL